MVKCSMLLQFRPNFAIPLIRVSTILLFLLAQEWKRRQTNYPSYFKGFFISPEVRQAAAIKNTSFTGEVCVNKKWAICRKHDSNTHCINSTPYNHPELTKKGFILVSARNKGGRVCECASLHYKRVCHPWNAIIGTSAWHAQAARRAGHSL